jgi:transposase
LLPWSTQGSFFVAWALPGGRRPGSVREVVVEVVYERLAGVDISRLDHKVCVRVPGPRGRARTEVRTFGAMTGDLLDLLAWLRAEQVTVVAMEATGVYWKPLYYLLEACEDMEPQLVNPHHVKALPGRKSDVRDCEWLADVAAHGMVRPSFVPPREIRQLRDLTRLRTEVARDKVRHVQRLGAFLEDAGIKLAAVASNVIGVGPRRMLEAMVAGERDPGVLAQMALGAMRRKIPLLNQALTGYFTDHHAFVVAALLQGIDDADALLERLEAEIDRHLAPFRRQVELLCTIPGIQSTLAAVLIAEIGVDMGRFPTAGHLASWAGVCPGNNQSGKKAKRAPTRPGDRWLKGALGVGATNAIRRKGSYLHAQYWHLARRRGQGRALVAVSHTMLIAAWHIMTNDTPYQDLGADHFTTPAGRRRKNRSMINDLVAQGYTVTPPTEPQVA